MPEPRAQSQSPEPELRARAQKPEPRARAQRPEPEPRARAIAISYVFYGGGLGFLSLNEKFDEQFPRKVPTKRFEKVAGGCGCAFRSRSAQILVLELSFYIVFWHVGVRIWR